MRRYTVVLIPEPDGSAWNVTVPALPGCRTWGATVEAAPTMARDSFTIDLADEPDAPSAGEAIVATVAIDLPIGEPIRSR